ncbi:MAG: SCO family protein [Chloroflexota bacterium]
MIVGLQRLVFGQPPAIESISGTVLTPPQQLAEFTLTGTDGTPVTLNDLRGSYTILSFGYTHCPDVCPLTLTEYKRVQRELGESADAVDFVFISVDGERDTPEFLGRYLDRFDAGFIGLTTDDDATMRAIADDFNIYYEKRQVEGTASNYLVDHTASTFLINPDGEVIVVYPFGTPPVNIATDIAGLL